ncbi:MAG: hypothetical protein ACI4ET_04795 [Bilifractor sp.]
MGVDRSSYGNGREALWKNGIFQKGETYSQYIYDASSSKAIPWYGGQDRAGATSEMSQFHSQAQSVKGYTKCDYKNGSYTIPKGESVIAIAVGDEGDIITGIHWTGKGKLMFNEKTTFWADVTKITYKDGVGTITYG